MISQVIDLVKTLYSSQNVDEQNEANRRLTDLQASAEAWDICWALLDPNQSYPDEVHFFAANVLVLKINQTWSQHSQEWLENNLRPKLLAALVSYAASPNGSKIVIDRLALALANFALHSIPIFWPDAIEEILQTFTSNYKTHIPQRRICDILLKILNYIPEEYSVMFPDLNHRSTLNAQIIKSGTIVFKFLQSILISNNNSTMMDCRAETLNCLASWIQHSHTSLLELDEGKNLINVIYDFISNDELCDAACTVLGATFDSRKAENYRNSVIEFMPKLASLKPVIDKYITEEDVKCVIKIYSLVINFCENHSKLMIKIVLEDKVPMDSKTKEVAKQSVFTLIKLILDCTDAPGYFGMDEKYSDITLAFWFSFFEVFYYYSDALSDVICDLFDPLVDSLLQVSIRKAQYPPTAIYHQTWNDDQREEYRRNRHDLGDVLSMLVQFPRARMRIFEQLHDQLDHERQRFFQALQSTKLNGTTEELPWQGLEAIIFGLKSMSESVPYDEEKFIPKIFDLLAQIPFSECQAAELYCTGVEMIAAFSDWLFTHTNYLSTAYKILFLGVTAPSSFVRLVSTVSLKDVTNECQANLTPYAQEIVDSCSDAILNHAHHLEIVEKSRLMHTFGCAVVMTPGPIILESLFRLTTPLLKDLSDNVQLDTGCRITISDRLRMLNSLIGSLHVKQYSGNEYEDADENSIHLIIHSRLHSSRESDQAAFVQPVITLLQQLIPILKVIVEKYRNDEDIMSKVAETVEKSARNLTIEIKPVLKDLIELLIAGYDPLLNFDMIQSIMPLYEIFKSDTTTRDLLRDAFALITDRTLDCCLKNPLRQLPTTVEAYFKFAHLICKKFFHFLSEQPCRVNIDLLYKLALASLELSEKKTLSDVCSFLTAFRIKSLGQPHLYPVFLSHLDVLLTKTFEIFGGSYSTPRNALEAVMDMAFFIFDANEARVVLDQIVKRDKFPTEFVTIQDRTNLISTLLQEAKRKNRRKFKEACTEFIFKARNSSRTL